MAVSKHTIAESFVDLPAAPRGSKTLEMLGIGVDDLLLARGDSILPETLRSTHELLDALRSAHVLDIFLGLPPTDRTNFLRWIASSGNLDARRSRTRSFVTALKSSPIATEEAEGQVIDVTGGVSSVTTHAVGTGEDRDRAAGDRDVRADTRDEAATARDDQADARDERADVRERSSSSIDEGRASDRLEASSDRRESEGDRLQAAGDRTAAAADRQASAQERVISSIDELTGAYQRADGLLVLEREMTKAKRTKRPMVVAFVDIDALKETNDSLGHAAGDLLVRETVRGLRRRLRAYDLIVRFGGDEFVCAMSEVSLSTAADRFIAVNQDLDREGRGSITVGLAEMKPDDTLEELIARADQDLYGQRNRARLHSVS